jgi:hypothetical protein
MNLIFKITFYLKWQINEESIKLKISQLNKQQKILFDKIVNQIEHQNLHKVNECSCKKNLQIKIFCSGVAGRT